MYDLTPQEEEFVQELIVQHLQEHPEDQDRLTWDVPYALSVLRDRLIRTRDSFFEPDGPLHPEDADGHAQVIERCESLLAVLERGSA